MKKNIKSPLAVLVAGLVIIGASSIGATRAAVVYQSAAERINFSTAKLSVILEEEVDGKYDNVADGELTFPEIAADENVKVGKLYDEKVRVVNNSNNETGYSEYVRVVLRKSWFKDGKNTNLDPELIKVNVADGWYFNEKESTKEQSVYYRLSPLACGETADFITGIKVDDTVTTFVESKPATENGVEIAGSIENTYLYNGENVYIQLQADAVQTHNAKDAIYAAWGINVTCDAEDDGNITKID